MMQEILQLWFKSWRSIIEIILLSVGIYYGYVYFRGTRGAKVLTGLAIVFLTLTLISTLLNLVVIGWIGGIAMYSGHVWEIHPLVVAAEHRHQGVGRALVRDLENIVRAKGAITLWVGTDDENHETSLSIVDLYADIPGAIRDVRNLREHPYEIWVRLGFKIVGVMPDANGLGKPDIFLAKRVI